MKTFFKPKFTISKQKINYTKKLQPHTNEIIETQVKNLFNDPNTYLQLPSESNFYFVIGKKIQGPRYDSDQKLITYSVVGSSRGMSRKKNLKENNMSRSGYSSNRIMSFSNKTDKNLTDNLLTNTIHDQQIKIIFNNTRQNISENQKTYKNDFLDNIPKLLNSQVKNKLLIQEKTLENNEKIEEFQNKFEKNLIKSIKEKNRRKDQSKTIKNIILNDKYNHTNYSSDLFNSSNNFILKRENYLFTTNTINNKVNYPSIGNGLQNWSMSLRRPKNFHGVRRGFINVGTDKNPNFCQLQEKFPNITENIFNPKWMKNDNKNNFLSTRSVLKDNNDEFNHKFSKTIDFFNKTMGLMDLEIKGKKLIDVEEDIFKQLKGKKKLSNVKYDRESLKDLDIVENWNINGNLIENKNANKKKKSN